MNSSTRPTAVVVLAIVSTMLRDHDDVAALLLRLADTQDSGDFHGFGATLTRLADYSPLLKELTNV